MTRLVLIFLALAVVSGALLFGSRNAPHSIILDGAFIASMIGFVAALVLLIARRAAAAAHARPEKPSDVTDHGDHRDHRDHPKHP